jgi:hypothetical protein
LCQTETTPLEIDSPTAGIFTCTLIARLHKRKPLRESNAKSFHLHFTLEGELYEPGPSWTGESGVAEARTLVK